MNKKEIRMSIIFFNDNIQDKEETYNFYELSYAKNKIDKINNEINSTKTKHNLSYLFSFCNTVQNSKLLNNTDSKNNVDYFAILKTNIKKES